jgi:hypothetical protein
VVVRGLRPISVFCLTSTAALACFPSSEGLTDGELPFLPGKDGSSGDDATVTDDGGEPDGATPLPTSCQDAFNRGVRTTDGDVEIDPDGVGSIPRFTVHCADMGTAPKEYLSLVNTTDPGSANAFTNGSNVSGFQMVSGQGTTACVCPDNTVRAFTKVRLKLGTTTVRIDLLDRRFSSSNRGSGASDQPSSCEAATSQYGRGNVDLRGTAFHIRAAEIGRTDGFSASGSTTYTVDVNGRRKEAVTVGGGSCGFQFPGNSLSELIIEHD